MSRERYLELYRKFLNNTISKADYNEFIDWLANPDNDTILRSYMEKMWLEKDLSESFDEDWIKFKTRLKSEFRQNRRSRIVTLSKIWYVAASVLILVVLSFASYYHFSFESNFYQTTFGETKYIELKDGSMVTLNANSILKWDENWKKTGKRKVKLTGEAFFDIETLFVEDSDVKVGFEIETKDLIIDVVGTSFNVKSREEKTVVYLDKGEVHLNLQEDTENSNKKKIILQPGDLVSYSRLTKELERNAGEKYENASWMSGIFTYNNESVQNILKSLEEIYGKSFDVKSYELMNKKLTTGLPFSDWQIVKSALELLLNSDITEEEGVILITQKE